MVEDWARRYFEESQFVEVFEILAQYGTETWHREEERVKRDALIISRGSMDVLKATVKLAMQDYRDVLVGEEIDPWVIGELKRKLDEG